MHSFAHFLTLIFLPKYCSLLFCDVSLELVSFVRCMWKPKLDNYMDFRWSSTPNSWCSQQVIIQLVTICWRVIVRITLNVMKSHELMETVEDRKLWKNSEFRGRKRKIQKSRGAEKVNYNIIFGYSFSSELQNQMVYKCLRKLRFVQCRQSSKLHRSN